MSKNFLDRAAEQLEAMADSPVADQAPSSNYWELRSDLELAGAYPQAEHCDESVLDRWGESEGLGEDGFPAVPFPEQKLSEFGKITDVINASVPAAWSAGHIFNSKSALLFRQSELGNFGEYPAKVIDRNGTHYEYTYFHIRNVISPDCFDFERSEFYLAELLGIPKCPVEIDSFEDWIKQNNLARTGNLNGCEQFSRIAFKKLYFKNDCEPTHDYFTLKHMSTTTYVTECLRAALIGAGITGLEFKINKRLFKTKSAG